MFDWKKESYREIKYNYIKRVCLIGRGNQILKINVILKGRVDRKKESYCEIKCYYFKRVCLIGRRKPIVKLNVTILKGCV